MGPRAVLDAVVKRKIPSPRRESNPRTPVQIYKYATTFFFLLAIHDHLLNALDVALSLQL
jgi:hypothetical protein